MAHRILIIDDNHSFIDTLKLSLKDFNFHVDSAYRFKQGEELIGEKGCALDYSVINSLLEYDEKIQTTLNSTSKKKGEPEPDYDALLQNAIEADRPPEIESEPFKSEGFLMVIIEHDAETSLKGMKFIQNLLSRVDNVKPGDFILLASKPETLEAEAREAGIHLLSKPVRVPQLKQIVQKKLDEYNSLQARVENIRSLYNIEVKKSEEKASRSKSTGSKSSSSKSSRSGAAKKSSASKTKSTGRSTRSKSTKSKKADE